MNDILTSHEYLALQALKQRLEIETSALESIKQKILSELLENDWNELHAGEDPALLGDGELESFPFLHYTYRLSARAVRALQDDVKNAEAALFAAFPPPAGRRNLLRRAGR